MPRGKLRRRGADQLRLRRGAREGLRAGGYVLLSVVLSLAGTWLGIVAARELLAMRSQS